jgi:hypothetical protein
LRWKKRNSWGKNYLGGRKGAVGERMIKVEEKEQSGKE